MDRRFLHPPTQLLKLNDLTVLPTVMFIGEAGDPDEIALRWNAGQTRIAMTSIGTALQMYGLSNGTTYLYGLGSNLVAGVVVNATNGGVRIAPTWANANNIAAAWDRPLTEPELDAAIIHYATQLLTR